jgi:hypothetical protein
MAKNPKKSFSETRNDPSVPRFKKLKKDGLSLVRIPVQVVRMPEDLRPAGWHILVSLYLWLMSFDLYELNHREIAWAAGCSADTVARGLKELAAKDYLTVIPTGRGRARYTKTLKLISLQAPYRDAQELGVEWTFLDLQQVLAVEAMQSGSRPVTRRYVALEHPTVEQRLRTLRGGAGPTVVLVPIGAFLRPEGMSLVAWRVLLGLYAYWQRHEFCSPSRRTLAWFLRCQECTIDQGIKALRAGGWVRVERQFNNSNCYFKTEILTAIERAGEPEPKVVPEDPMANPEAWLPEMTDWVMQQLFGEAEDPGEEDTQ